MSWLRKAHADYSRAIRALDDGDYSPSTFMSQQVCEKAFKALYLAVAREVYKEAMTL